MKSLNKSIECKTNAKWSLERVFPSLAKFVSTTCSLSNFNKSDSVLFDSSPLKVLAIPFAAKTSLLSISELILSQKSKH